LHTVSLKEAREKALEFRKLRLDGIDPLEHRRAARTRAALDAARVMSFRRCAEAYIEAKRDEWTNAKHAAQWQASLEQYAYPLLGPLPVAALDTDLIVKALEPHWRGKRETINRVRGRIEAELDWATVRKFRTGENPARWKGHLEHVFAGKGDVEHHAALPAGRSGRLRCSACCGGRRQHGDGARVSLLIPRLGGGAHIFPGRGCGDGARPCCR
jgi:hypothetical protein